MMKKRKKLKVYIGQFVCFCISIKHSSSLQKYSQSGGKGVGNRVLNNSGFEVTCYSLRC